MNKKSPDSAWFETWFDTDYYHTLYSNRDEKEAELFIGNLLKFLQPNKQTAHFLDLACGKGRHSVFMNQQGFKVTGVDLSENSISKAKVFENEHLRFAVHDMRQPLNQQFSHIFNLFTSFGYFDSIQENEQVMNVIAKMTKTGDTLVIDYLNAEKVVKNLVAQEQKIINQIQFNISRKFDDHHVYKFIEVIDQNTTHNFMERVQLLRLKDFKKLLEAIDFEIIETFGNFQLEPYDLDSADRLILIAQKR